MLLNNNHKTHYSKSITILEIVLVESKAIFNDGKVKHYLQDFF